MRFLRTSLLAFLTLGFLCSAFPVCGQQATSESRKLYDDLRSFHLSGGIVPVENLVFHRDRAAITFTSGIIYFEAPVGGHVYGAVFIGEGKFVAEPPPVRFEKENVKRLLNADNVESDFKTAVLHFTDDTFDILGKGVRPGEGSADAQKLAGEFESRLLKETGANMAARMTLSLQNGENPGVFLAQFDKGKRGRFGFIFDPQGRVPSVNFEINGGEKGLIFYYKYGMAEREVWMAFYSLDDYAKGRVDFSDVFDQVAVLRHDFDIDVHSPDSRWLRYDDRMEMEVQKDGIRAIHLAINETLSVYNDYRLKRAMRVKSVKAANGLSVEAIQEDWEGGLTLLFPAPLSKGQKLNITLHMEGEHLIQDGYAWVPGTDSWYLRHGYLQRSTYRFVFHHSKRYTPVTLGSRVQDAKGENNSDVVTEWKFDTPAPFIKFAVGDDYVRYQTEAKIGDRTVPIEFDGPRAVKADFIGAEMNNALRYYSALFGPYPYDNLHAVYHGAGYGQGMATMLLLPNATYADKYTFVFLSHEVGHQWWGDMTAWRSYRDQWLSEGFAEYSALLYTGQRDNGKNRQDLIDSEREALRRPPYGLEKGLQKGHLAEVGPIILGHRLSTRETGAAYTALIYDKGALVLRMLHFLFTDQTSMNDKPFFEMMTEFVNKHAGGAASTEDFIAAANERFTNTPTAKKYHLTDLNWFFQQWVYSAGFPSYRLEYQLQSQPDGSAMLTGTLYQEDLPADEKWFMPLPLVLTFGKGKVARGTIAAVGPKTPISVKLPAMPEKVELDPDMFVLSLKTEARKEH
jgi:hypothetical protein